MKNLLLILLFCSQVFSVGEAGAVFLLIAPGASAVATGEAQVAKADDVYASYYNPAGLGFLDGSELGVMHVNWLPNLADDIYFDFLAFRHTIPNVGTIAANMTYLNLGEQVRTDELGNAHGTFKSNMWALSTSFGSQMTQTSSVGLGFKVIQQNLAPNSGAGAESTAGSSTNILFDLGYLKKFQNSNFGLSVSNIGPEIWFQDKDQADPAPTNMKFGIYAKLYDDTFNKISLLVDANKLLVARYPAMDWNGDRIISGNNEIAHHDSWYKAIFTSWLDDWYYGGDYDLNGDDIIGGWDCGTFVDIGSPIGWSQWAPADLLTDENGNLVVSPIEEENGLYECNGSADNFIRRNSGDYAFNQGDNKVYLEKGSGDSRSFKAELEEMIYNIGLEYWYSNIFVIRAGYIYDYEGKISNPTFGAGLRFGQYGFDFGYTAGEQGHPRANTMFFSVNIGV